jgi:hypothetical protein
VLDVLYVLNTSSDPALVESQEAALLEYYFTRLHTHLDREVAAGNVAQPSAASYTRKAFHRHYQVRPSTSLYSLHSPLFPLPSTLSVKGTPPV